MGNPEGLQNMADFPKIKTLCFTMILDIQKSYKNNTYHLCTSKPLVLGVGILQDRGTFIKLENSHWYNALSLHLFILHPF